MTKNPSLMVLHVIAILLLLFALGSNPYGYYQVLRIAITGISGYFAYLSLKKDDVSWMWIMIVVALLFNPILPIYLDRSIWAVLDVLVAGVLSASIFRLGRAKKS